MKQRTIALLLALALTASLCAVSVLADEQTAQAGTEPAEQAESAVPEGTEAAPEESPSPAGPDLADNVTLDPDPMGQVSFANVESRIRGNNLQYMVLEQNIQSIEVLDYEKMTDDMRKQLNSLANAQAGLLDFGMGSSPAYSQLEQAYSAIRQQFDAIRDGDLQEDNAAMKRQLENLQDQIVMAGESLYLALSAMEVQESSLRRQLAALDRTVQELELRYQLGQVSSLQVSQAKSGRASLVSGMETLAMNIKTYKLQLEVLMGAEQTGVIALSAVPAVTEAQLEAMDLEEDLERARETSYELLAAKRALEDARDSYKDAASQYNYNENHHMVKSAQHTWQAAQYTYNDAVQQYELKFRTLFAQVKDCRQIWEASKVTLACEQAEYAAAELRYQQGSVSQNALLTAKDELDAAEEAVRTAADNLFSTYNTYCWAVEHGILN